MNTAIVPVSVFPSTANTLMIRSITLGPPPSYYYELQDVQVVLKEREVANPDYKPASVDENGDAVPEFGTPTMKEPYQEQVVTVLKNGNVNMTAEQWDGWSETVDDDEYQLDCISANLGLTRA